MCRYQYIGGSNVSSIGNVVIDINLLLQAKVSMELIRPKDFSSDKKVEELFSFSTASKVSSAVLSGEAVGKIGDYGALLLTFLMSRLHLHAINSTYVPAKHRSVYIITTMLFFISIDGINPITKRNMILESIANVFLILNKDIKKIRHTTSELCEHMFGNIRQERREFTCSEFCSIIDKQNRRIALNFKSGLSVTKDSVSGYQETLQEFLQAAMCYEDSTGPCAIDIKSSVPVSEQQWPQVKHVLNKCANDMKSIFDLLEVKRKKPFSDQISTRKDLIKEILKFCPRSFKYNDMTGSIDSEDDDSKDAEVTVDRHVVIAENIKKHVDGILNEDDADITCDDDIKNKIDKDNATNEMQV